MVFILILPVAMAGILPQTCLGAPVDNAECQNILSDTSITQTEKEDLYLNLLNSQTNLPNHEFVRNWNNQIAFSGPPNGVVSNSNGTLKNAWLKIVGVNKSVFDTNEQEWFFQPHGQIQVARHFDIQIPTGTQPGDCQTHYSHSITQDVLTVKANGMPIGNSPITNFDLDLTNQSDLNFEAYWSLTGRLSTDHYQPRQHCFNDGHNMYCWNTCDFINTTYDYYSQNSHDELSGAVLWPSLAVLINYNERAQKLRLIDGPVEPVNEIKITQGSKSFSQSQYRYDINQTLAPYGTLFITRTPENKVKSNFIVFDHDQNSVSLATSSPDNCQLHILTDFEETTQDCSPVILTNTRIELAADKNQFDRNETIHLQARLLDDQNQPLANQTIHLATKNTSQTVSTNGQGNTLAEFQVEQTDGVINAYFEGLEPFASTTTTTRITTGNSQNWITLYQLVAIFGTYYMLYLGVKRKVGAL